MIIIKYINLKGWSIYSQATSGGDIILSSDLYFRILLSLIVSGWAITFKRSIVTTRFGRRLLGTCMMSVCV